jgi:hypothetical protein
MSENRHESLQRTHAMATLRNTASSLLRLEGGTTNIAARLRHHAAHAERPISLILTS